MAENEIEEILKKETPDVGEIVRLDGKYVWETAKRMCDFINAREGLICITSLGEYRVVMKKVMMVIKEAHLVEWKRRQTSKDEKKEETKIRTEKAKALIQSIRRGKMRKDEIGIMLEETVGGECSHEIENVTTMEKIVERIEELSKREEQFEEWEKMRRDAKMRQREDRRLNLFWRRKKCFPAQFGGEEETPDAEGALAFWRGINNKDSSHEWRDDESIQDVIQEMRVVIQKRGRCRCDDFTEEEFDKVLRCTAPWKACGVDSVYSFPIKSACR